MFHVTNVLDDSQQLTFPAKYLRKNWIDLHQISTVCRSVSADDKSYIPFAVVQLPRDIAMVTY